MVGDSIRRFINRDDFTLVREDDLFAEVDLKESITFREIVDLVHARRAAS
jgi:hypothetical protein